MLGDREKMRIFMGKIEERSKFESEIGSLAGKIVGWKQKKRKDCGGTKGVRNSQLVID